jgi:hypothetical protein
MKNVCEEARGNNNKKKKVEVKKDICRVHISHDLI